MQTDRQEISEKSKHDAVMSLETHYRKLSEKVTNESIKLLKPERNERTISTKNSSVNAISLIHEQSKEAKERKREFEQNIVQTTENFKLVLEGLEKE